jgi:hypothetical protein
LPSPTPQPAATATATATAAATETALPTPTATIAGVLGPIFPENINPLTGQPTDLSRLARRPLAIKVSNAPPLVRPQHGLNSADLVFEHLVEGGYTRFTAVFYSQNPEIVGPIRSARLIDLELPLMLDAAFAYSGSSGPVRLMFQESPFFPRLITLDFAHGGFYREDIPGRRVEHTLFTNPDNLRYILQERGQEQPPQLQNGLTFSSAPLAPGTPATRIELQYPATNATWSYSNGRYWRWTDGEIHLDANTNIQLNYQNVLILAAHHQETNIIEDEGGNRSIQIQLWGSGPASVFRNGQRIEGNWQRLTPESIFTLHDLQGNPLPLSPGNSFIQIVPLGFDQLFVSP